MRNHETGQIELDLEARDQVAQPMDHQWIHHRGWFVIEHSLGFSAIALAIATDASSHRDLSGETIAFIPDSDHVQNGIDGFVDLRFVDPAKLGRGNATFSPTVRESKAHRSGTPS